MKLLILGGTGFLSGTLVRLARQRGDEVWTLTSGRRPLTDGAHSLIADRKDAQAFQRAINETHQTWDAVIDCIGFTEQDASQDLDVFPSLTQHLIFISTDFVYGRPRPWQIDETWAGFEHQFDYGRQKHEAELVLAQADNRMRVTILRPCHIYGPGSRLGCFPEHGRDPDLLNRLKRREPITLVGGGHFLQQPVFAPDLARMILSCVQRLGAPFETFHAVGPDIVESRSYYEHIAKILNVELDLRESAIDQHLHAHPENAPFLCHRVYSMWKATMAGIDVPSTPLQQGLAEHVSSMIDTH